MNAEQVIAELSSVANEGTRRVFARRQPDAHILGVKFGDMGKIVRRIKTDHALARSLWAASDAFEVRHVACAIMDPAAITEAEIDEWVQEIDVPPLSDDLAAVVHRTSLAATKRKAWTGDEREYVRRAGYTLAHLAATDVNDPITDEELRGYLLAIRETIHTSPNWAREMMNYVTIAIGHSHPHLFEEALATARAYGRIDVFHGDKTNCKVKYAVEELTHPPVKRKKKASEVTG